MLRVKPSSNASAMRKAQSNHSQARLRAMQAKKRNAVVISSANISWPPNVIQWLVNPVMRSAT